MQKVHEDDSEIIFTCESHTQLKLSTIAQLAPLRKSIRIVWPRQNLNDNWFRSLANHFHVQIGMEANNLNVASEPSRFNSPSLEDATVKDLILTSFDIGYALPWQNDISTKILNDYRQTLQTIATNKNTLFYFVTGTLSAAMIIDAFDTYRGKKEKHLCWIWIDQNLSKVDRKIIAIGLLQTAQNLAPNGILASVYLKNFKSISFLKKAGFESICVKLQPL